MKILMLRLLQMPKHLSINNKKNEKQLISILNHSKGESEVWQRCLWYFYW
jgi:hypothetical protein